MKHVSIWLSVLSLGLFFQASGQTPDLSPMVQSPRPLADASTRLQQRFGKPITYEETVLVWANELEDKTRPGAERKWNLFPKMQTLIIPMSNPSLEGSVRQALETYHLSSNGNRFDVLTSKLGLHIVPRRTHDEHGALVEAHSLLDATITIASAERTPLEHLLAIGAAVTAATGTKLDVLASPGNPKGFDNAFRAAKQRFAWGANSMVARDALIDLLDQSATTFTWNLYCQSSTQATDRMCGLNLMFVAVAVTGADGVPILRALEFDRCGDCPPLSDRR